ncbi:GNAT family N-acetyltransferase [Hippea maritima]|uniref:N-acetyltransferase domain-containing protein n=1 Tax=Hippea maritima (strain ATCC 700847 / DSM 10411 / MH2) TaxID=760142 RepID=F2LUK2_HIPMA|nr:GNAT family N-acetyltransferase [Hippea maritima]AEA34592.1 hypothetical protein Hipma_1642 [Hippea maritima DSM 10411]
MNNYEIREYKPGDSKKICELLDTYTPYDRDEKFWIWINRLLSIKKTVVVVAESKNKIVGHYAVIPQYLNIKGNIYNAGLAIHAFIHPDYRNTFMVFEITKMMHNLAKKNGIEIIYGFPNSKFRSILLKIHKWKEVALFKSLEKFSLERKEHNFKLIKVEKNYLHYYELSEILDSQINNKNKVKVEKNLIYFVNRYINHPQNLYKNFFIEKNGQKVAFIVLKIYEKKGVRIGHLIDYVKNSKISFQDILNIVENYFYDKVNKLSFWKFDETQKEILLKNGFEEKGFETCLGIKMLIDNKKIENFLLNFDNWTLCMGDSDAF